MPLTSPNLRATLSLHTDPPQGTLPHYDLFLEPPSGEPEAPLPTYEAPPHALEDLQAGRSVCFTRKAPHRRLYLDYTGELSQNRGTVTIHWQGFHCFMDTPASLTLQLKADTLHPA